MFYIPIIVGSTQRDRQTIKVARFVLARLQKRLFVKTELLDLLEYDFPLWKSDCINGMILPRLQEFRDKIGRADSDTWYGRLPDYCESACLSRVGQFQRRWHSQ